MLSRRTRRLPRTGPSRSRRSSRCSSGASSTCFSCVLYAIVASMAWRLRRRRDRRVTLYIDAGLRGRGRPGRVRRRPALLPGPDSGRVEDLRPEEHLRRRLRYYDRRPRRHAGRAGSGEEEGERVAGQGGAARLCCRGLSASGWVMGSRNLSCFGVVRHAY